MTESVLALWVKVGPPMLEWSPACGVPLQVMAPAGESCGRLDGQSERKPGGNQSRYTGVPLFIEGAWSDHEAVPQADRRLGNRGHR